METLVFVLGIIICAVFLSLFKSLKLEKWYTKEELEEINR